MEKEKKNKLKALFRRKKNKKSLPITSITTSSSLSNNFSSPFNSRASSINERKRIEEELEQVFKKFDVNGDGKISSSELASIMTSLGTSPTEDEIASMIQEVDSDKDGFIDLKEFIELNTKDIDSEEMLANLKDAFSVFDMDKNGSISADELHKVLKSIGEECTLDECKNMINGVDANGDGLICFDEFKVMMMNGTRTPANIVGSSNRP